MKPFKYTRRALNIGTVAIVAIAAVGGGAAVLADQRVVKIGITLPFTGADAEDATLIKNEVMIAFDEANAAGGVAGYKIVPESTTMAQPPPASMILPRPPPIRRS